MPIAQASCIGRASAGMAGNTALQTPGCDGRSAGGKTAISRGVIGSGSSKPSTGRRGGMTREASVGPTVLCASRHRNQCENQRNRGEVLHKVILLPFSESKREIPTAVKSQARNALSTLAVVTTWPTCLCV
jgi:hypothetical protein